MIRTIMLAMLVAISVPAIASAQTIVSYKQEIFGPGVSTVTGSPIQTNVYTATDPLCNQAPLVVPPLVVNPGRFFYDDPVNSGKVCIIPMSSVQLAAIPNGVGFVATISRTDDLGQTSGRSAASNPFNQQGVPAALTGYKAIR